MEGTSLNLAVLGLSSRRTELPVQEIGIVLKKNGIELIYYRAVPASVVIFCRSSHEVSEGPDGSGTGRKGSSQIKWYTSRGVPLMG